MVYVATTPPSPASEAILVKADSPIRNVTDLKGKKVALNKGSNVHYFLVKALASAGLQPADIQPVYLPPADARPAFERGRVDAWAIWDPFYAAAQQAGGVRVLVDGKGLVANREFFLATQTFVKEHPDLLSLLLEELNNVSQWARENPRGVAALLAPELGMDTATVEQAAKRRAYGVEPLVEHVVAEQQHIADTFYLGGSSLAGQRVAAKHVDVYLTWGEPPAQVAEKIATVRRLAREQGRTLRFGIRLHVIVRETAEEAWEAADRLIRYLDDETIAQAQRVFARFDSEGQRRMVNLHKGRRTNMEQPQFVGGDWAGAGRRRSRQPDRSCWTADRCTN